MINFLMGMTGKTQSIVENGAGWSVEPKHIMDMTFFSENVLEAPKPGC